MLHEVAVMSQLPYNFIYPCPPLPESVGQLHNTWAGSIKNTFQIRYEEVNGPVHTTSHGPSDVTLLGMFCNNER